MGKLDKGGQRVQTSCLKVISIGDVMYNIMTLTLLYGTFKCC